MAKTKRNVTVATDICALALEDKLDLLEHAIPLAAARIAALQDTPIEDFDRNHFAFALNEAAEAVRQFLEPAVPAYAPAVPVEESVADNYIVSLVTGKQYKVLSRHLTSLGLTPAEYRARYGLPDDYPMVAPAYTRERSKLALSKGLGKRKRG